MENREIIQKAILKAEKNGYKGHLEYCPLFLKRKPEMKKKLTKQEFMDLVSELWLKHLNEIIFSHKFAKTYWSEKDYTDGKIVICNLKAWQYHLQAMVLEEKPLKYLKEFLK